MKEQLKKLFYTNNSSQEIRDILGIDLITYNILIKEVKEEFGLPEEYRRTPHLYGKYTKNSFFILEEKKDDFEIIGYYPTLKSANSFKNELTKTYSNNYTVYDATDENLKNLLKKDYFTDKHSNELMKKYQLPYHKFYSLLNEVKKELGVSENRVTNSLKYIYKYSPTKYVIKKTVNGKIRSYGYYNDITVAIYARNYLEKIGWDKDQWEVDKPRIIEEATHV